jgi:hypothetical protein
MRVELFAHRPDEEPAPGNNASSPENEAVIFVPGTFHPATGYSLSFNVPGSLWSESTTQKRHAVAASSTMAWLLPGAKRPYVRRTGILAERNTPKKARKFKHLEARCRRTRYGDATGHPIRRFAETVARGGLLMFF